MDYAKLRNKVETSKLSITDLCKKLHIDRKTFYNNIENKTLKVETLEKICAILNLQVWEFFYETKPFADQENTANIELLRVYKRITELQDELSSYKDINHSLKKTSSTALLNESKERYKKRK